MEKKSGLFLAHLQNPVFHFHKNTNNTFVDINLFKTIAWH